MRLTQTEYHIRMMKFLPRECSFLLFLAVPLGGGGGGGVTLGMCGGERGDTRGDGFHAPEGKFEYLRRVSREETYDEKNEALPVV